MIERLTMSRISQAVSHISRFKAQPGTPESTWHTYGYGGPGVLTRYLDIQWLPFDAILIENDYVRVFGLVLFEGIVVGGIDLLKMPAQEPDEIFLTISVWQADVQNT